MTMTPRKEAALIGATHYRPKKPCKRCGESSRYVSDWTCVGCRSVRGADWDDRNRETRREWARLHADALGRDERNSRWRKSYLKSPAMRIDARRKNRERTIAIKRATPLKLTFDQREQIKAAYAIADLMTQHTGVPHEVDHIVPLFPKKENGQRMFYGMHVPWNLQVIPKSENRSKRNAYAI